MHLTYRTLITGLAAVALASPAIPALAEVSVRADASFRSEPGAREAASPLERDEIGADYLKARDEMRTRLDAAKTRIDTRRDALKAAFGTRKDGEEGKERASEAMAGMRAELRASLQERRAAFEARLATRTEERASSIAERRLELKDRLSAFGDDRKEGIVLKVDAALGMIAEKRTRFFAGAVDRIDTVLIAIEARAELMEDGRGDLATARARINDAEAALAEARAGVVEQAARDYTVEVSEEGRLRAEVSAMRDELREDLVALRALVRAAHEATREAADALRAVTEAREAGADVDASASAL